MRWALAAALVAGACAPAEDPGVSSQPVYGGTTDIGDPNVVYLLLHETVGDFICTGSVIGKRTILTAGHCVEAFDAEARPAEGYAYFGNGDPDTDLANRVDFVDSVLFHGYAVSGSVAFRDVAVIYLAADALADPVVLNDERLEDLGVARNTPLRAVGWGDIISSGAGTRRTAEIPFANYLGFDVYEAGDAASGTCAGDSGGPSFLEVGGVERQVGVTSFGPRPCNTGPHTYARVDIYIDNFIIPAIDYFESACKVDGVCVTTGCRTEDPDCNGCGPDPAHVCNPDCEVPDWDCPVGPANGTPCTDEFECESRICTPAVDDPRLKFCSQPCAPTRSDTCLATQTCDPVGGQNICRFKAPSPGAQGANCGAAASCRSGLCDLSLRICVEPCDPSQANACPAGYECTASSLAPFVCAPPGTGDGGCSAAGGGSSALAGVGSALLLALALRRRRQR